MSQDELKRRVAQAAVAKIVPALTPTSIIGVGTGSTANFFIDALAEHRSLFFGSVASSETSAARLRSKNIAVLELNEALERVKQLPFYVDGADEVNPRLELVKGGGGALTREKIVAAAAATFICIVDGSKRVEKLGTFPVPIEVIPMSRVLVARGIEQMGGRPNWRKGFVTDNGNDILDVSGLQIADAVEWERKFRAITGVVTVGLFAERPADILLVGLPDGVHEIQR